jgi:hypothetical protein
METQGQPKQLKFIPQEHQDFIFVVADPVVFWSVTAIGVAVGGFTLRWVWHRWSKRDVGIA